MIPQTTATVNPEDSVYVNQLCWLAEQGARFALPRGRTKSQFEAGWPDNPHTLDKAITHAQRGGNVGLLTGKHSSNIIALDIDSDFDRVIERLARHGLTNTAKIIRDNASDRGKLLYRVTDKLPRSTSWKRNPSDKHPAAELLSNGRHALIPPSMFNGGHYTLIDQQHVVKEVTYSELDFAWRLITGESFDSRNSRTDSAEVEAYRQRIKDAWSPLEIFKRFDKTANGTKEEHGEIRLLGNGGLLIDDQQWYCHANSVGGDALDAWHYCETGRILDRGDGKAFWNTLHAMADAAGIERLRTASADSDDSDDQKEFRSSKSNEREDKPKQADELYRLAKSSAVFFQARQDGMEYATVAVDGHRECYRLKSKRFDDWLGYLYYEAHGTIVGAQAKVDAKSLLAFEARKTVEDVFLRVGHANGKVYIDLCTAECDAIEVDETGWRIVANPPVNFRRTEAMLPLPTPVDCKDPLALARYLNIEEQDWPLVAGWFVMALHPRGPYPVLSFLSRAGSGKSTALRILKRLIDPSAAELRSQPGDVRDLFIAASNSWLLAFDNISQLSSEVSDALCVIATGGGYTRKANYTDQEESVINVQRPIVINGIGDVISRQDLMDRAIVVNTPYISESERKDEDEFWRDFEENKPKILGAFLYALSRGLANIHSVNLERKPRMADFAKLAVAAEPAYTDTRYDFIMQYTENRDRAADTIVENSPVGGVILRMLENSSVGFDEQPEDIFLKMQAEAKDYEKKAPGWPNHHNQLKETFERIAPALDRFNIRVKTGRSNGKRYIRIWKDK